MTDPQTSQNPLLTDWTGAFGLPPFAAVAPDKFRPAFDAALAAHRAEIDAIAGDPAAPTFDNTIVALERSGRALDRVSNLFWVLAGADTNDAIEAVEREMSPLLARHSSATYLNRALFARIAALYARREALGLDAEQARVLERYHTRFVRAGAALDKPAQERLAAINERLASLGTQFAQNVLADEKAYALMLEEGDLAGLPDFARAAARAAAAERGSPGKFAITLARSSCETFLQFSSRRDLREKVFQAWIRRGENGGATDNRAIIAETVRLRAERAKLLGFATFADYRLDDQMAKTPAAARKLLEEVWGRARAKAAAERDALQKMIAAEGGNFALAPHDWRYYAEKRRKAEFDLDEAEIKPYFQLDKIIDAAFETARRLFGLTFTAVDVPLYHPDARAFEVKDASGKPVGLFIGDYFARSLQAFGRLDDLAARPGKAHRRGDAGHPQHLQFRQARRRRAGAAVVRRCPHAVPRIRPRAARAPVERHLSAARRHSGAERFRRIALAALRALAGGAGDPAEIRAPRRDRRSHAAGAARQAPGHAHLQPGLRHRRIHFLRAGRSRFARARRRKRPRRDGVRAPRSGAHPYAGGDRDAPPPAAFPAFVLRRRLRGGLLLLHVVGGARRRRLRGLRGGRRRLRSGDRPSACANSSTAPAICATRPRPTKPSAAGCRRSTRC